MDMGMNTELERDGGSEGEAMSTEGSSAGSMYCTLEQDYARIMTEMKTNESLASFEAEYTRLYEALYKSNQLGVELNAKLEELREETARNSKVIADLESQTKSDATNIEKLNAELLEFKKLADVAHTREQRAQEVIGNLRVSITKLTDELELKNKQLAAEDTTSAKKQKDGAKDRDILLQEVDTLKHRVKTLTSYNQEVEQKLTDSEEAANELQERIGKLENDLNKERREREKYEVELQASFEERRLRLAELETVEETLRTTAINYKKHEELLREQVEENEAQSKHVKRLNFKISNLKAEIEKVNSKGEKMRKEIYDKGKIIKDLTVDLQRRTDDLTKTRVEKENAQKKLLNERGITGKYKSEVEQMHTSLQRAERDIEIQKKALEQDKKTIDKLNREKDLASKNYTSLEEMNKRLTAEIHVLEQSNRKLEAALEGAANTENELRKQIKYLEKERDRCLSEAQELTNKVEDYMDVVKMLRIEIADYQKRVIEADAKYRQHMTLFEEIRSERNTYKKNFSLAQEEITELKNKLKNMSLHNSKLEEQLMIKNNELLKQEFLYNKLDKEKETLEAELENCRKNVSEIRHELDQTRQEEKCLRHELHEADVTMARQKKEIESVMNERDIVGAQIVRRNDEMRLQNNKLQVLSQTLTAGEKEYAQRMDEIRMLKIEIKKLRLEKGALIKHTRNLGDLRSEVFNLERNLTKERIKVVALEEEIQNPLNIHRWRNLEGIDPDSFELLNKIQILQKRILKMSSELVAKDKQIKDTEKLYMNLREIVAKQPGPEVLVSLTKTRKALRDRGKKMKCLVAELNMTLKTEHKFEIDKVKKELSAIKAKFYAQKKKCSKSIEPVKGKQAPHYEESEIDLNKLQDEIESKEVETPGENTTKE